MFRQKETCSTLFFHLNIEYWVNAEKGVTFGFQKGKDFNSTGLFEFVTWISSTNYNADKSHIRKSSGHNPSLGI